MAGIPFGAATTRRGTQDPATQDKGISENGLRGPMTTVTVVHKKAPTPFYRGLDNWVPDSVRQHVKDKELAGTFTRRSLMNINDHRYVQRFIEPDGTASVLWVGLTPFDQVALEVYREFPKDLSFYQELAGGDIEVARLVHLTATRWDKELWHLIYVQKMSPERAKQELRRIYHELADLLIEAYSLIFSLTDAAMSLGQAIARIAQRRMIKPATKITTQPKTEISAPQKAAKPVHPLSRGSLAQAADEQRLAEYYWAQRGEASQKAVAHSEGKVTVSGPGYSKALSDFPQRAAPAGESESAFYVRRYEKLSGSKPPRGRDYQIKGDEYASHAEVKDRIHQFADGTNTPTGVSEDMCGNCRLWHRNTAKQQSRQIVVADPNYTRVFNPDGTVDLYTLDGTYIRTIPAGVQPSAGARRGYQGVDW